MEKKLKLSDFRHLIMKAWIAMSYNESIFRRVMSFVNISEISMPSATKALLISVSDGRVY